MNTEQVTLKLLVNDKPVITYGHQGRTYVEAREGSQFTLRLKNNTAARVEAVISVDGLSVLDGEPAAVNSRGYILAAYQSYDVVGWRKDLASCARFIFSARGESYAAKTGQPRDIGVVGLMAWKEKTAPPPPLIINSPAPTPWYNPVPAPWSTSSPGTGAPYPKPPEIYCTANFASNRATLGSLGSSSCAASASATADTAPEFKVGTGWGHEVDNAVSLTSFERGELITTVELHYTTATELTKLGIDLKKAVAIPASPKPGFPVAFRFCRPPS